MYTGRDAALPQLVELIKKGKTPINTNGIAIMHTAVSDAGIAPTTSNKEEIESTIPFLSENGVKIHIGKGMLNDETKKALNKKQFHFRNNSTGSRTAYKQCFRKRVCCF